MKTFQEYIKWVQKIQPKLDNLWERAGNIKGVYQGCSGQRQIYAQLVEERLGTEFFFSGFHPSTDNLQLFTGSSIDDTLTMLDEIGYNIENSETDSKCCSFWIRNEVTSDYHRLQHGQGTISLQVYRDPASLLFYFGQKFDRKGRTAVARFTDRQNAEYHCKIPKEKEPDVTFDVETAVLINSYGHSKPHGLRLEERVMEDRIVELMEAVIKRNTPALYQTRGTEPHCVINQPKK